MTEPKARVYIKDKCMEVHANTTVAKALRILNLNLSTYLAVRNGELVTEDMLIKAGDEIRLFKVISGG